MKWKVNSPYGDIDITINLSKPEKDPKAIAAAKNAKQSSYPKCQLCMENEGYAGRINHPARQNHRIMPIEINGGKWGFQYSPYVYYNEHCIVFNGQHVPMKIDRAAFTKLFDFCKTVSTLFPWIECRSSDRWRFYLNTRSFPKAVIMNLLWNEQRLKKNLQSQDMKMSKQESFTGHYL